MKRGFRESDRQERMLDEEFFVFPLRKSDVSFFFFLVLVLDS